MILPSKKDTERRVQVCDRQRQRRLRAMPTTKQVCFVHATPLTFCGGRRPDSKVVTAYLSQLPFRCGKRHKKCCFLFKFQDSREIYTTFSIPLLFYRASSICTNVPTKFTARYKTSCRLFLSFSKLAPFQKLGPHNLRSVSNFTKKLATRKIRVKFNFTNVMTIFCKTVRIRSADEQCAPTMKAT